MKRMEESRKMYENMVIPEELEGMVEECIRQARTKRAESLKEEAGEEEIQGVGTGNKRKGKSQRAGRNTTGKIFRWAAGIAAAFLVVTTVGLNTSEAFAMEVQKLPVIGDLAKILTIRSYERTEGDTHITAEIPGVELGESDNGLSKEVNAQIEKMTSLYEEEAIQRAEEYKEAFLATGGTEEEWEEHDIQIKVWYEIKCQTENTLSFVVKGTESWTSAYAETRYYNLDLKSNSFLSLEDVLGTDYKSVADGQIRAQIEEYTKAGETFFTPEEGGFTGITGDTSFYLNEKGNPVIVFEKYAIAPGAMGEVEFEITR